VGIAAYKRCHDHLPLTESVRIQILKERRHIPRQRIARSRDQLERPAWFEHLAVHARTVPHVRFQSVMLPAPFLHDHWAQRVGMRHVEAIQPFAGMLDRLRADLSHGMDEQGACVSYYTCPKHAPRVCSRPVRRFHDWPLCKPGARIKRYAAFSQRPQSAEDEGSGARRHRLAAGLIQAVQEGVQGPI